MRLYSVAWPLALAQTAVFNRQIGLWVTMTVANSGSSSLKRRRGSPKFYAVRTGARPGIYYEWDECLKQVKGFKGACYKSFNTQTEAEQFVSGAIGLGRKHSSATGKFYAVRNGRTPGIYTDWESARQQIQGWPKPRHKCFSSRSEAQNFIDGDDGSSSPPRKKPKTADELNENIAAKSGNSPDLKPSTQASPLEDGFESSMVLDPSTGRVIPKSGLQARATKLIASGCRTNSIITVYTDGSSLGNGRKAAVAGVGVYFGPGDPKNISEPLSGPRQTNQRAELTAVLRALESLPRDRSLEIVTDSQYTIKCVTEWCQRWISNGWKNSSGKPVENRDIIEQILHLFKLRNSKGASTKYRWTKGHSGDEGNAQADKLAVEGAKAAAELVGQSNEH